MTHIGNIRVRCRGDRFVRIPALITGHWAAHGVLSSDLVPRQDAWTVSHVPSGRRLPSVETSALIAVGIATALQGEIPEPDTANPDDMAKVADLVERCRTP